MRKSLVAILLLAFACWLVFTNKSASQETSIPVVQAQETPVEATKPSEEIVIKDKAIAKPQSNTNSVKTPPRVETPKPPTPSGAYTGRNYTKDEVIQLIKDYSARYGINSATPLCIAKMESGYNQFSKNKSSTASGVFQYLTSTWRGTDEGRAGLSVFDADANVRAAVKYMAIHKSTQPWVVRTRCPSIKFLP